MITHDLENMTLCAVYDKYTRYFPISVGNRYDESHTFNAIFELKADLGKLLDNIKENYCKKENPSWLVSDFICYVQRWLHKNMPGYNYRFSVPHTGQVVFVNEEFEKLMPVEKINKLAEHLLDWIDICYHRVWG